jgi:hypothetical protein
MKAWKEQGLGVRWVMLMVDDPDEGPPSIEGVKKWKDKYGLASVDVVVDQSFSFVTGGTVGTPMLVLVDPRTMVIQDKQEGFSGNYSKLVSLAQKNQGQ